jgi:hypothetical protein
MNKLQMLKHLIQVRGIFINDLQQIYQVHDFYKRHGCIGAWRCVKFILENGFDINSTDEVS